MIFSAQSADEFVQLAMSLHRVGPVEVIRSWTTYLTPGGIEQPGVMHQYEMARTDGHRHRYVEVVPQLPNGQIQWPEVLSRLHAANVDVAFLHRSGSF
jgi:hypothetical protein